MKKYRKKPVIIEAIQWDGTWETSFDVIQFCEGNAFRRSDIDNKREYLYIKTLEGEHIVSPRDFIIKGIKCEFYPCKPDIFELTYEEVNNA
jgi:hypothetical protein